MGTARSGRADTTSGWAMAGSLALRNWSARTGRDARPDGRAGRGPVIRLGRLVTPTFGQFGGLLLFLLLGLLDLRRLGAAGYRAVGPGGAVVGQPSVGRELVQVPDGLFGLEGAPGLLLAGDPPGLALLRGVVDQGDEQLLEGVLGRGRHARLGRRRAKRWPGRAR